MRAAGTAILVLFAVVALGGCSKHDTKAQEERERTIMMERLLEAAGQHATDGGTAAIGTADR